MNRPLFRSKIGELEQLFANNMFDDAVLNDLEHELSFRTTASATSLSQKIHRVRNSARLSPQLPLQSATTAPITSPTISESLNSQLQLPMTMIAPVAAPTVENTTHHHSVLSIEDACKVLKVVASASWDKIEQSRREIVERARPNSIVHIDEEKRQALRRDARLANEAVEVLFNARKPR